ncbi:MAG: UDP-glucose 6-dehydrogenase, partial [Lachnospiraceae bacterium]|nr:UDP-glucose 6-dehydrogenase [Lachnospiraceae bacterium]
MNIAVAGAGYVGLSVSLLLAGENRVTAVDTDPEKVKKLNTEAAAGFPEAAPFLKGRRPDLTVVSDGTEAYRNADIVIICTPTDYDEEAGGLDTSSVEAVIEEVTEAGSRAYIVIRSTVPVGFTDRMNGRYGTDRILFSPEFLREAHCLEDSFYPSRVIIGARKDPEAERYAREFGELMLGSALSDAPLLLMSPAEAEAAKLFANTYLAAR